jgi:hypothetical protein
MCSSTQSCSTLRYYLSTDPEISPDNEAGPLVRSARNLLLRRLKNYFFWKGSYGKMAKNLKSSPRGKEIPNGLQEESAQLRRKREYQKTQPPNKRRRLRGGASAPADTRSSAKGQNDAKEADLLEQDAGKVASEWVRH